MSATKSWIIGSSPGCDIVLTKHNISRNHCRLTQQDNRFFLEDLQSTNGTFVNGVSVSGRVEIRLSDQIVLGSNVPFPWPDSARAVAEARAPVGGRILGGVQSEVSPLGEPSTAPTILSPPPGPSRKQIRIGRDAANDLVLDYAMVSSHHAVLSLADGQAILEDLNSTNGTAVNSPDNTITRHPLRPDDVVYFGSLRVPASRLLAAHPTVGVQAQDSFAFAGNEMTFGRHPQCDQVLDYPMISSRHARIFRSGPQLMVEDLQSANGTFVNGTRIHRPVAIQPGDTIGLGSYTFKLNDRGNFEKRDFRGNVTIEARDVAVEVPGKRLIDQVSLTIYPSEFVGLMGPSGAGKTTLMNALNGYVPPTTGAVLFNGRDLYGDYARFASSLGYVPQDDIIHSDLTVGQALYFTAKLRLPPDTTDREIEERIARVLQQLGLESTKDVLIGSPERKGISGGQRKRVNLAMELLTDPSVLFLDEPTSGLSSEDALMVMKVLRQLADSGKAILLTIHQPSLEAYRLMDNLVLIGKDQNSPDPGELVYYGPAYPDAVQFFNPQGVPNQKPGGDPSPDEVLRGFSKQPAKSWVRQYDTSKYKRDYVIDRAGKRAAPPPEGGVQEAQKPIGVSQWATLVRRYFTIKLKDTMNTAILLAQAPIIAFLVVMVFGDKASQEINPPEGMGLAFWTDQEHRNEWTDIAQATSTTVFLMGLAALWFGCSNAVREIVGEWAIYHRERMVNLKLPSYLGSKLAVLGGLCLIQCLLLLLIIYLGCGLEGNVLGMLFVMLLVAFVGVALGLLLSALAKTSEVAIALLPIVLLPIVILGGMMRPVHDMNGLMRLASNVAPLRWAYESTFLIEAKQRPEGPPVTKQGDEEEYKRLQPEDDENDEVDEGKASRFRRPDIAHESFPESNRSGSVVGALVLTLMLAFLVGAILMVLRARDVH